MDGHRNCLHHVPFGNTGDACIMPIMLKHAGVASIGTTKPSSGRIKYNYMARSSYIYIVDANSLDYPTVQSAFTVKYEMLNWLKQCRHPYKKSYRVFRLSDGGTIGGKPSDWGMGVTDITAECQDEIHNVPPPLV